MHTYTYICIGLDLVLIFKRTHVKETCFLLSEKLIFIQYVIICTYS